MVAPSGAVDRGRPRDRDDRPRLLPSGTGDFARRRAVEAASLLFVLLGASVLLAGLTFDAADPSLNRAVHSPVRNLLGPPGAYGADIALHSLGLALFLAPPAFFAWAWRLWRSSRT